MDVSAYFGSFTSLDEIKYRQQKKRLVLATMADEENTPPKSTHGGESGSGRTPESKLGGTSGRRRPHAPRGRPQPFNLEVVLDANVLVNLGWQDERGMWMYSND